MTKRLLLVLTAVSVSTLIPNHGQSETLSSAKTQSDRDLPPFLEPLRSKIETVLSHHSRLNLDEGLRNESQAAVKTQQQKFFPTVSAGVNVNRNKTETFEGQTKRGDLGPATDVQLSVGLRQNLYNGGADVHRLTLSETKRRLAELRLLESRRSHVRNWLKNLAAILHQKKLVEFQRQAKQRAHELNTLASRKEAAGFMGRRDVLDSQRELIRIEQDSFSAENTLREMMARHKKEFGFEAIDSIRPQEFPDVRNIRTNDSQTPQIPRFLALQSSLLETNIAESEHTIVARGRFSPRLDTAAQVSQTRNLNPNGTGFDSTNTATQKSPDTQRSWSVSLTGEIALAPATAFGLVEESLQRVTTARMAEQKVREQLGIDFENAQLRYRHVRMQKDEMKKLLELTQQLRDKNQRLFEAGELSIDRLIASQQDLNRDQINFASIEFEEISLAIDLLLADTWDLSPSAAARASMR